MARIRTIKPEFFTSEDIVSLSPLARVFYIALWCEADREGRLAWKPKTLKMRYLPADNCEVEVIGQELIDAEMIVLYEVDGAIYAEIPSFIKHQVINNREASSSITPRVKDASPRDQGEGRKGRKGKEGNSRDDAAASDDALFDQFWETYPKKVGKDDARKSFAKRKPSEELLTNMLQALEVQKVSQQWAQERGKYIPNPSTWLNQGRWQDGVEGGEAQGSGGVGRFV